MSKAFFKAISESAEENVGGKLFMIIDNGECGEDILGLKMFVCGKRRHYNRDGYGDFWNESLAQIRVTTSGVHTLANGVRVFAETLGKRPTLVLCGGGHVSVHVYTVAVMVGFDVVVIDDREEFVNKERFPLAKDLHCGEFAKIMKEIDYGDDTYFVLATRGHSFDSICLEIALKKPHTYLGMIGSGRKVAVLTEHLQKLGFTDEEIQSVYTPIGLSINAQTPEEIAISIMAEIISVRRHGNEDSFVTDEGMHLIAHTDEDVVLSMILHRDGSIPRGAGAKMAVTKSGIMAGSIGGGTIEYEAKVESMRIAGEKRLPHIHLYAMTNTDAEKEGMACGGSALVYQENIF